MIWSRTKLAVVVTALCAITPAMAQSSPPQPVQQEQVKTLSAEASNVVISIDPVALIKKATA